MRIDILSAYTRVFVDPEKLQVTVDFYRQVFGAEEKTRFDYPEKGLLLVGVQAPGLAVLVIAGSAEDRRLFEATRVTVAVTSLEQAIEILVQQGAVQLEPVQATPKGRKTRFVHPDGLVVEYVENGGS